MGASGIGQKRVRGGSPVRPTVQAGGWLGAKTARNAPNRASRWMVRRSGGLHAVQHSNGVVVGNAGCAADLADIGTETSLELFDQLGFFIDGQAGRGKHAK